MSTPANPSSPRRMRSYVIRAGRKTAAQQEALDKHWGDYVIDDTQSPLDIATTFGREAPLVIEIGFGMGDSLADMAEAAPDTNFLGIEVHRPGVGKLLHTLKARGLGNVKVYCHDAVDVLQRCVADHSVERVQIFFPDPWHKKRHHKRRLIQPPFVDLLKSKLTQGGTLHLATDWQHYAEHMMAVLSADVDLKNLAGDGQYSENTGRPETKFERRGQRLGHGVWDLIFEFAPQN